MNETVILAAIAAATGGAIAFAMLVYLTHRQNDRVVERLEAAVEPSIPHALADTAPKVGGLLGILVRAARGARAVGPLGRLMDRLSPPGRLAAASRKLEAAGMRDILPPRDMLDAQIVGGLGGLLIMLLVGGGFTPRNMGLSLLVALVVYRLSVVPITNALQRRQAGIRGALPKAADILVVAVEAGMTLDKAIGLYSERFAGPLSEELRRVQEDIKIGHRRSEAFKMAMSRVDLDDLSRFLGAIMLAERFGVPVAMVLRDQSDELKQHRSQRIREASMKAPIKMLVPTVALILPALFVVLLGPIGIVMATGGLF